MEGFQPRRELVAEHQLHRASRQSVAFYLLLPRKLRYSVGVRDSSCLRQNPFFQIRLTWPPVKGANFIRRHGKREIHNYRERQGTAEVSIGYPKDKTINPICQDWILGDYLSIRPRGLNLL